MAEKRLCSVDGCGKPHLARGLCNKHYLRLRIHGHALAGGPERHQADFCSDQSCNRRHFSRGLCRRHYAKWKAKFGKRCSVSGCDRPHNAHGFCQAHEKRFKKFGDPYAGRPLPGEVLAFLSNVVLKLETNDCFPWPYTRSYDGYAKISANDGGSQLVSRRICESTHGPAPTPAHHAAHTCGKGHEGCVNPRHIVWKTPTENMADKLVHGTHMRGERAPNAKLTERQVLEIRSLRGKMPHREIAELLGISIATVRNIIYRIDWAWLP